MPKHKVRKVKFSREEMAYDLPAELDLTKMTPVIGRGVFADEYRGGKPLKIQYVVVDRDTVSYSLDDGRSVSAPLGWYPRLRHATPAERNDWRLIMDGRAVLWQALGIALSAKALLEGTKAGESPAALRKWLTERSKTHRHHRRAVA